jgi:ketosteroid isomerase-like protein
MESSGSGRDTAWAMSEENVEAFRRGIDAYNRGEIEAVVQEHDPDVEWHPVLLQLLGGEATVYRGHEGIREMIRDAAEAFTGLHFEVLEIRDLGDRLLSECHLRGRGKASGAETETTFAFLVDFRNGKIVRVLSFLDRKDALEAAGLSE